MTHDNTYGPLSPPPAELLDMLRRIAEHDDAPDTVQADARSYLQSLEATLFGSVRLTAEGRLTLAASAPLQHGREIVETIPRPRSETA